MPTINDLPNEILIEIFSYIHVQKRQRLVTVCKRWRSVIEMMWRPICKLIINIGLANSSYSAWEGANCANILCRNIPDAINAMEKLNGNLTKLDFEHYYFANISRTPDKMEWNQLSKEIQKNKQLKSIKIARLDFDDKTLCLQFLQCLPTKNLQYLSIPMTEYVDEEEIIECLRTLVKVPLGLRYLCVDKYTPSIENMINGLDTLESLHLGDNVCDGVRGVSLSNITKLPNLREFTVEISDLVDDEFLITLGNNCNLCALDADCNEDLSQSGFDSIGKLENLSYLKLFLQNMLDIEILSNLLHLEELYINFGWSCYTSKTELQLNRILKNLPKLKRCWFYDFKIHNMLELREIIDQSQLKEPQRLCCTAWKRIFGIPRDHS